MCNVIDFWTNMQYVPPPPPPLCNREGQSSSETGAKMEIRGNVQNKQTNMSKLWIRGGRYGKNIISRFSFFEISRFTILWRFFVMLVLLFCKLSEQYSQINFPIIKPSQGNKKGEKRTADIYNNNNLLHLYNAFLGTQSALHERRRGGGRISWTTTNVQLPPGWCNGSHIAPERPPHPSLLVERRQSDEANRCMGMIKRPWWSNANLG